MGITKTAETDSGANTSAAKSKGLLQEMLDYFTKKQAPSEMETTAKDLAARKRTSNEAWAALDQNTP